MKRIDIIKTKLVDAIREEISEIETEVDKHNLEVKKLRTKQNKLIDKIDYIEENV